MNTEPATPHSPQSPERPQPRLPQHLGLAGLIVAVIALLLVIWGLVSRHLAFAQLRDQTDAQAILSVTVRMAKTSGATQALVLPGAVQAYTDAPIYARTSGFIKRWYFDIGAQVKAGQLLAEIDTPEVDQQYLQAQADLGTAKANYALAKSTAARWQELLKAGTVSQQDADEKSGDAAAKLAAQASAAANVERLKALESFKRVVAPFTGVITARNVDIGDLIGTDGVSGRELFHVADTHIARIYVQVPQTYAAQIRPDTTAELSFAEQPGRSYPAKLAGTAQVLDPATKTLMVQLQADNAAGTLLSGAYAQVSFKLKDSVETLRVPGNTLIYNANGTQLAVVGDDNHVQIKPITVGRDFGDEIEVVNGLTAQDRIIINPPDSIASGEQVRIAPPPKDTSADGKPAPADAASSDKKTDAK